GTHKTQLGGSVSKCVLTSGTWEKKYGMPPSKKRAKSMKHIPISRRNLILISSSCRQMPIFMNRIEHTAQHNKSLEGTANSAAFIRETCVVSRLRAPPLSSSVRRLSRDIGNC
ncbi:MAG: hypothetical protein ACRD9R_20285, partial [Pyrinomonadaceae bacterium]